MFGKPGFLTRLRIERLQLIDRVAKEFFVLACSFRRRLQRSARRHGASPSPVGRRRFDRFAKITKSVEQATVIGRVKQTLAFELAVHLDQRPTERFEQTDTDRLIVDEGARAAVAVENPTQDQIFAVNLDALVAQLRMSRVVGR